MAENRIIPFRELMMQPSEIQITCSAYSAINWLKLMGARISHQTAKDLVEKVITTKMSLQEADLIELAHSHGYKFHNYCPNENHTKVEEMVGDICTILDHSPILQNISTHFSKKSKGVTPIATPSDMKEAKGKLITHSVVLMKQSPSLILIIDPYDPTKPEVFDISNTEEQLRFLSWVMSSFYQYRVGEREASKKKILNLAKKELSQPKLVQKKQINMFGFLQARLSYLVQTN